MGGCVCIGCLEKRLGRKLTPKDFPRRHPFNSLPGTERLIERQDLNDEEEATAGTSSLLSPGEASAIKEAKMYQAGEIYVWIVRAGEDPYEVAPEAASAIAD